MTALIRGLTIALCLIPPLFVGIGLGGGPPSMTLVGGLLVVLYAGVWGGSRPRAFRVEPDALVLERPLRPMRVPRSEITGAAVVEGEPLKARLGVAVRVGVGGLWGVFGWLWTSRAGWVEIAASGHDRFVWIERRDRMPLLVTPERMEEFVEALGPVEGS